eukprot:SAG31_NODE_2056_length_6546_cov_1.979060_10_plen_122_part_00
MTAALSAAPRKFQDIRALPLAAGGAVFFTHRVIHWGSASVRCIQARSHVAFLSHSLTFSCLFCLAEIYVRSFFFSGLGIRPHELLAHGPLRQMTTSAPTFPESTFHFHHQSCEQVSVQASS